MTALFDPGALDLDDGPEGPPHEPCEPTLYDRLRSYRDRIAGRRDASLRDGAGTAPDAHHEDLIDLIQSLPEVFGRAAERPLTAPTGADEAA